MKILAYPVSATSDAITHEMRVLRKILKEFYTRADSQDDR